MVCLNIEKSKTYNSVKDFSERNGLREELRELYDVEERDDEFDVYDVLVERDIPEIDAVTMLLDVCFDGIYHVESIHNRHANDVLRVIEFSESKIPFRVKCVSRDYFAAENKMDGRVLVYRKKDIEVQEGDMLHGKNGGHELYLNSEYRGDVVGTRVVSEIPEEIERVMAADNL